jgi:hypothetical protein
MLSRSRELFPNEYEKTAIINIDLSKKCSIYVPSFRRWRLEMKLSPFITHTHSLSHTHTCTVSVYVSMHITCVCVWGGGKLLQTPGHPRMLVCVSVCPNLPPGVLGSCLGPFQRKCVRVQKRPTSRLATLTCVIIYSIFIYI